ncbi:MAG: VWA domain-containing protein [Pyrinomonadaceae bacterium]
MFLLRSLFVSAFVMASAVLSLFVAGSSEARPGIDAHGATGVVATPTPPIQEEEGVIKVDTEAVNVLFTAQDKERRLLLTLKPEDIRVLENGQAQEITAFSKQVDLPLSLSILIDTSVSQQRTLPEEKSAAIAFLESVVRPAKDEVAVISFTGESTLEQGMTNNLTRLRRAIDRVKFTAPSGYIGGGVVAPGTPPISGRNQALTGSTAIWDAVWVTSVEVLGPAPESTRRAIILLTDGVNTSGSKKLEEAVDAALRSEAVIYAIGIGDDYYGGVNKGSLNKISEQTGGRAFFPRDERQLREAFKQIQEEMRSQYLLAYEPTNTSKDGTYRRIEIELVNQDLQKQKIKLTHRQGYFAKSGK